jgi:hypothetical protein
LPMPISEGLEVPKFILVAKIGFLLTGDTYRDLVVDTIGKRDRGFRAYPSDSVTKFVLNSNKRDTLPTFTRVDIVPDRDVPLLTVTGRDWRSRLPESHQIEPPM